MALAHALLVIIYHVIARRQPYQELGADYFQRLDPAARVQRLVHQLTHLGFEVQLHAPQTPASTEETPVVVVGS